MMHHRRLLIIAALVMGASVDVAHAQDPIVDGVLIFQYAEEETFNGSTGSASFSTLVPVSPSGPINASFITTAVTVVTNDPVFGSITSTLDPSRPPNPTTISSYPGNRFPALASIRFYGLAQISSKSGTFASNSELVLSSTLISLPFNNNTFTLENDVQFHEVNNPETVVFTLKGGSTSVVVSGGPEPPPDFPPDGLD